MKKIQRRQIIKTVSIVLAGVITFFLSEYTIIALINFLFYSNNHAKVLQPHINEWIPDNFSVNDVLTHEVLYPAWNINTKRPIFFSKITNEKYKDTEKVYDIPLRDMVWASATNPNFFGSATISYSGNSAGDNFFGGNTVASNPSLYSNFLSTNYRDINPEKIRIVSIGSRDYSSDKLSSNTNVLDWFSRLYQLTGPVKKYTQNYMVEHILRKNNRIFSYFVLQST